MKLLAPAGRQVLFVSYAVLHIVYDKNKAPRKERKIMKSETMKKPKTKEIVYLEDEGRTVPVLKECLDLVHDVRRIIKKIWMYLLTHMLEDLSNLCRIQCSTAAVRRML